MPSMTLAEIAAHIGGEVKGDANVKVSEMGNLQTAKAHQLSFLSNSKYAKNLLDSEAGAVILNTKDAEQFKGNAIIVNDAYVGFAKAAQLLDTTPSQVSGIAASASIASTAELGTNVSVGEGAVIAANARIGSNSLIGPNCYIGEGAILGEGVNLRANVTIYHKVELGNEVSIHSGAVIGSDGFGYANDKGVWLKIPQTGTVIVGEGTEIGSNSTIDRGALDNTIIGKNVIIDNMVHLGHNVIVGDHSCICGATGIAGSCTIGKYVIIGGGCGINGHISIADKVQITGNTMVTKTIKEAGVYSSGMPAQTNKEWQKNTIYARQLGKLVERVKRLEKGE